MVAVYLMGGRGYAITVTDYDDSLLDRRVSFEDTGLGSLGITVTVYVIPCGRLYSGSMS